MDQHEIVAARFQDGPINELYAIVGRNNKEREALTEWVRKYVHHVRLVCEGRITTSVSNVSPGANIRWGYSHDQRTTEASFLTIKL